MAKTIVEQKIEDLRNQNCNIRNIKSEVLPGKIRNIKTDTRGYGLSDTFQDVVDKEFEYYAPEETNKNKTVSIDTQLQLGNQIAYIPAKSIINLELIESQDNLWYYGSMIILDANSFLLNTFKWRGTESLQMNFGHVTLFIPIVATITAIDLIEQHGKHSVFRINFAHPGWSRGKTYVPYSSPGPKRLSDVVKELMKELDVDLRPNVEATSNIGVYTNPGMDVSVFLQHIRQFAISKRDTANYSLFTSFGDWFFVSKDYFNRQAIARSDFSFSDNVDKKLFDVEESTPLILAQRWGPINSFRARTELGIFKGSAYDFKRGESVSDKTVADVKDIVTNKTMFSSSYDDFSSGRVTEMKYTGFRNPTDEKGFLMTKADEFMEGTSTGQIAVRGHYALGARGYMRPGASLGLSISKGEEENKKNLFAGNWVVNTVTHKINHELGWRTVVSFYRNSY